MFEDRTNLDDFAGVVRLFPLPGMVLFPHAVQPLHIFEQRYREMTENALADDRLIALAIPLDDVDPSGEPKLFPVACLGKIFMDQKLPDGRFNLLLRGLTRVRIIEELETETPYRKARVEIIPDESCDDIEELMSLRSSLADLILPRINVGAIREHLQGLFKGEEPLSQICDVLSFALPISTEAKRHLLEMTNVVARAKQLMEDFQSVAGESMPKPSGLPFPPEFSRN